jgi:D-3-phosphoglycerate dehydrogenase
MKVMVWGSEASRKKAVEDGFLAASSKASLFESVDVLSIHLRLNDETKGIVTASDLALMKKTSLFVNTSRAELVQTDALAQALLRGRPGLGAVDVYESEPILQGQTLLKLENCICTPHIGYVEEQTYELYFGTAFDNVLNFINGTPSAVANPEVLKLKS